MTERVPDFRFVYRSERRQEFRDGTVWKLWRQRYQQLFDKRDEDLALSMARPEQGGSHFFEWLSAVLLYEATGLLSMQANFVAKNHPEKRARFHEIVGPDVFTHVDAKQSGLPDLFVYSQDKAHWFFCEVKGGPDRIRANQLSRFAELHEATKRPVRMIELKELKFDRG